MKEAFEFYCEGGCRGYTIVQLDTEIDANIIMKCPSCGHEHMRKMRGGKITGDRHDRAHHSDIVHLIEPTKAAFSKQPRLAELQKRKGLLAEVWGRVGGGP